MALMALSEDYLSAVQEGIDWANQFQILDPASTMYGAYTGGIDAESRSSFPWISSEHQADMLCVLYHAGLATGDAELFARARLVADWIARKGWDNKARHFKVGYNWRPDGTWADSTFDEPTDVQAWLPMALAATREGGVVHAYDATGFSGGLDWIRQYEKKVGYKGHHVRGFATKPFRPENSVNLDHMIYLVKAARLLGLDEFAATYSTEIDKARDSAGVIEVWMIGPEGKGWPFDYRYPHNTPIGFDSMGPNPFVLGIQGRAPDLEEVERALKRLSLGGPRWTNNLSLASHYLAKAQEQRDRGSADARSWYRKAIIAEPKNPFLRFHYGEYLRRFRGPDMPLLPMAADEYLMASRLLEDQEEGQLREDISYSVMQLLERDGIALLHWPPDARDDRPNGARPFGFLSSQIEMGEYEISVRDLTSSLLFTEAITGRLLSEPERSALLRPKPVTDWLNRARLRPRSFPWIDVWWRDVRADDALVDPENPGRFHDYEEQTLGVALERTFDLYPWFDTAVRIGYRNSTVTSSIDDGPDQEEAGDTFFGGVALSRVFPGMLGPNRLLLSLQHEETDIDHIGAPDYRRSGSISGASLKYSIYPSSTLGGFVLRSSDFDVGAVRYGQQFGDVDVDQHDVYAGIALRKIVHEQLDIHARVTFFEEEKKNSGTDWHHGQRRLSFAPLWRASDNENASEMEKKRSRLRFFNLFIPLDVTEATEGPSDFDSRGYGVGLTAKLSYPGTFQATFLLSVSLTQRDYFELGDSETLWRMIARMGF